MVCLSSSERSLTISGHQLLIDADLQTIVRLLDACHNQLEQILPIPVPIGERFVPTNDLL